MNRDPDRLADLVERDAAQVPFDEDARRTRNLEDADKAAPEEFAWFVSEMERLDRVGESHE